MRPPCQSSMISSTLPTSSPCRLTILSPVSVPAESTCGAAFIFGILPPSELRLPEIAGDCGAIAALPLLAETEGEDTPLFQPSLKQYFGAAVLVCFEKWIRIAPIFFVRANSPCGSKGCFRTTRGWGESGVRGC